MRRSLYFFIPMLLIVVLTSACGPSIPGPTQPTQTVETVITPTMAQVAQAAQTPTKAPSPSAPQATITSSRDCNPPAGWSPYTVKSGDTLFALAKQVNLTPEELMRSNCLASSLINVGDTLYLPTGSCTPSPPASWRTYVVHSGDTLFSLATTRDTTVAKVKEVNCLVSDSLEVGKQLYLPPLVVVPPPVAPPAAPQVAPLPLRDRFGGRSGNLPSLALAPVSPNDPTFKPCTNRNGAPWISLETEEDPDPNRNDLQQGQRAYYFACDFSDPTTLTAQMAGPSGTQPLDVLLYMPNPDLQMGEAQGVVDWTVPCDLPPGPYTLTIRDGTGAQAPPLTFNVNSTDIQRILVVPEAAPAGTTFQVYYCGYEPNTSVQIDLYYVVGRLSNNKSEFRHADSWNVAMNARGWATEALPSSSSDLGVVYYILDHDQALDGETPIRLIR